MIFSSSAFALQPENALSNIDNDSVYMVLKLDNTSRFMKWLFSKENMNLVVPLILKDDSKLKTFAFVEAVNALVNMTPLRSAALIMGVNKTDIKNPYLQLAFTVAPELRGTVRKIERGNAEASDIAKLLIGDSLTASAADTVIGFTEKMIKVEKEENNIYRVNNDIFMKVIDDLIIIGSSIESVNKSENALKIRDERLFMNKPRKFNDRDFALLHLDFKTASLLDDNNEITTASIDKYIEKPLDIEFSFKRTTNKFTFSSYMNLMDSLKERYTRRLAKIYSDEKSVKGGNIDINTAGGKTSPLFALGTNIDFASLRESTTLKSTINNFLRNMRLRFGIPDEETTDAFTGKFSLIVNDSVMFEGFKIPAVYISQTGKEGAAKKIYDSFSKSQHFSKLHDDILQLDTSLSPISCLVANKDDKLLINFADLSSLSEKPELRPEFAELMERDSYSSWWIDFAGIQSWLTDEDNGVMSSLTPIAGLMGYGKYVKALNEILRAEFSVPSMSMWTESPEVYHMNFDIREINSENGFLAKLLKCYFEFYVDK